MINIVIVEDHKVVADGLEQIINKSEVVRVLGKSHSAADCMRMLAGEPADVLLLDISLPDGNGIDLCLQIKSKYSELKILMLTSHSEMTVIMRALENGASGYILKNATTEEIIEGICTVASGEQFLCDEVSMIMRKEGNRTVQLSRREQELLRLIVEGHSNSEIAESMYLGYETVKSYRKNLILKLDAHNTAALVKIAIEQKLI